MIKIELKPITYQIEIPDYGEFDVSPLGAGAEAEIRYCFRELNEKMDETKRFSDLVEKEKNGEKLDTESQEYKDCRKALDNASKAVEKLRDTIIEKMRGVFKGKNVEKLFNDFSYEQILEIHNKATKNGKADEE